jgi:hypothetical protein
MRYQWRPRYTLDLIGVHCQRCGWEETREGGSGCGQVRQTSSASLWRRVTAVAMEIECQQPNESRSRPRDTNGGALELDASKMR